MNWFDSPLLEEYRGNLVATGVLVLALLVFRVFSLRLVRRVEASSAAMRLRWTATLRNISVLVFLLGMVVIWATELRTFALSVVALAAALVLAAKELLMCMSGAMLRASGNAFSIGHRVEVGGVRGDVIDHGLLTTTILETGPGHQRTGRTVVLPNSVFLSTPVVNETLTDEYVLHVVTVPSRRDEYWDEREQALLTAAREAAEEWLEPARRAMEEAGRRHALPTFGLEPRVVVHLASPSELTLAVRVPTTARERGRTEQRIVRRYLELTEHLDRVTHGPQNIGVDRS